MKRSPREIKEAAKAYDKVVDYLVAEDYAKSKEDADQWLLLPDPSLSPILSPSLITLAMSLSMISSGSGRNILVWCVIS